jgi:hypothetical protein
MTKRVAILGAIVLMAFAVLAPLASADGLLIAQGKQIDFTGGKGGVMSFQLGMGNSLSVNSAPIGNLVQFPSFFNFPIIGGFLNLTTGACESAVPSSIMGLAPAPSSSTTAVRFRSSARFPASVSIA